MLFCSSMNNSSIQSPRPLAIKSIKLLTQFFLTQILKLVTGTFSTGNPTTNQLINTHPSSISDFWEKPDIRVRPNQLFRRVPKGLKVQVQSKLVLLKINSSLTRTTFRRIIMEKLAEKVKTRISVVSCRKHMGVSNLIYLLTRS